MPKSVVHSRNWSQQVAAIVVVVTTVFAIIASGLKAMDDNTYEVLHTLSLVVMLSAYIFFIGTIASKRRQSVLPVQIEESKGSFVLYPCDSNRIITISPRTESASGIAALIDIPRESKDSVRAIVARGATIDIPFLKLMSAFPNVVALDIQNCTTKPEVWNELIHFEHLQLVLAHGVVRPEALRDLSLGMLDIRICIEPSQLCAGKKAPLQPAA